MCHGKAWDGRLAIMVRYEDCVCILVNIISQHWSIYQLFCSKYAAEVIISRVIVNLDPDM